MGAAGVSIYRAATVKGRFGGSVGARKKVSEIRSDIVTVECAREVDNASFGSGSVNSSQQSKRPLEHDHNDDSEDFLSRDALLTANVCRRFHNRLAIVGSSPGCIVLGEHLTASAS